MTIATDQHKNTFCLRDDLAAVLQEEVEADSRAMLAVHHDADEQFYADLAESLITRGWVVDYPDKEAA